MKKTTLLILLSYFVYSCKTYTVSVENFKSQLLNVDKNSIQEKKVSVVAPYNTINQKINNLKTFKVIDKNNLETEIQINPALEMRVTLSNGKKKIMYFDTIYVENDTLFGSKSRLLNFINYSKVAMKDIVKIEIQEGGKKYDYAN